MVNWKDHRLKKYWGTLFIFLFVAASFSYSYIEDQKHPIKGEAKFELSYRFQLQNVGPSNLSSITLRLANLKTWDTVQTVHDLKIDTQPNLTVSDEFGNDFSIYEYGLFEVNRTIDLQFHSNLTVNLLNFNSKNINFLPYDINSEIYNKYTLSEPFTDLTDPAIQNTAINLGESNNPLDISYEAYNFSSTHINYKLLSRTRGASFALRNGYGDCDEYTTLFIALLRARGIPAVEHTAWLADFQSGFTTSDEGAAAHAYPMFYLEGIGWLPVDPTRGNTNFFDNYLKTDEKRITMTRGPNQPYRLLKYRWVPQEGIPDPLVASNYTISIHKLDLEYFSIPRLLIVVLIIAVPIVFITISIMKSQQSIKKNKLKRERILSPSYQKLIEESGTGTDE